MRSGMSVKKNELIVHFQIGVCKTSTLWVPFFRYNKDLTNIVVIIHIKIRNIMSGFGFKNIVFKRVKSKKNTRHIISF